TIVRKGVVDLKEYGGGQRALLGVTFVPVTQEFIDSMGRDAGVDEIGGVYVNAVSEDGAASAAGIRKGDVIMEIDGVKICDGTTLQEQIGKRRPNDKVNLSVKRGSTVKQFEVTLRNKAGKTEPVTRESVDVVETLGGKLADAGAKLCRELGIDGGVQVAGVKQGGVLARARVKPGFVITHVNDRAVRGMADLRRMSESVKSIDGVYPNGRAASYTFVE
ncbi:MAG: PDZ domain-containing protein, partial [Alistipes sp.]|nr:PDZ domain-containing protein [Alistipes sp.]